MSKPLLIIDAGHGGSDPGGGSSVFYDPNGFYEKDVVLEISRYQYRRFRELGMNVILSRDSDVYISPADRAEIIRNSGATYCISNHINAASNASARGVETIHSVHSNGKLAQVLYDAIVAEGMSGRRVFTRTQSDGRDYYFMHRNTGVVSTVIVEYGFATNTQDAKLITQNWERYAEAVVRAFCEFVGHAYKPPASQDKTLFTDVDRTHWAHDDIVTVSQLGLINGYPDGTFRPNEPLTRAEFASVLARMLRE